MVCDGVISIRPARKDEFPLLPDIEMDAGYMLADYGLNVVAEMPAAPAEYYENLPPEHFIHLACDENDSPMGFALCLEIDGEAHLKELSVRQCCMQQGVGTQLIQAVIKWAMRGNYQFITLTTYRDIPFNGPFYQKMGFISFTPEANWPDLAAIRDNEISQGLDIQPRTAMRLLL